MESINPEAVRAAFRGVWRWWEWYLFLTGLLFFIAFAVHGSAKDAMTKMLASELTVIKAENAQSIQERAILKEQNERSIKDREYLHEELKNTRASLKRLEKKVQTSE